MSRITAPIAKLVRTPASSPVGMATRAPAAATLLDSSSHSAGASLMPKYAELLHNRRSHEHSDTPRSLTTTHRPTPQPSLTNRPRPLMQTFHSASPTSSAPQTSTHIDATVFPSSTALLFGSAPSITSDDGPRVPLLPDNYTAAHGPIVAAEANPLPQVTIVAADPDKVVPGAPNAGVEGLGLDGVDFKFLYDEGGMLHVSGAEGRRGMIRDIWKGLVGEK
ncbi:hypothetical protein E4U19_006020 [Claviceps sp. Clav32 group G5]|nr:hypothetical protein E4U19_006020 [Claviceps sp. Clav32 group G5]KAG6048173.1 hypothetical protein E4U39_007655 [Claviceps sp. Clav50 group G5]